MFVSNASGVVSVLPGFLCFKTSPSEKMFGNCHGSKISAVPKHVRVHNMRHICITYVYVRVFCETLLCIHLCKIYHELKMWFSNMFVINFPGQAIKFIDLMLGQI